MSNESFELIQVVANQASRAPKQRPRRHRAACTPRNLAIFKKVEIEKFTAAEVAHEYNIHRSRVSQIVKKVRLELAQASADDPEIKDHLARQRLDRHLEKLRLEYALEASAKAMRRTPERLVTNRAGSRSKGDTKEGWSEIVTRDTTPNVQPIKTYLRVSQDLGNLQGRQAQSAPPPEQPGFDEILDAIQKTLEHLCYTNEDDDPPSARLWRMLGNFRVNIFTWLLRRREGASRAEAWPDDPPLPASFPQRHAALQRERRIDAGYEDPDKDSANRARSKTHTELTPNSAEDGDATSDQTRS